MGVAMETVGLAQPLSEEEHLRTIWRELGVGKDGYLDMSELSAVCDNIGMEEMNAQVTTDRDQYYLIGPWVIWMKF